MKNLKNLLYIIPLGLAVSCAPEFEDEITFTNGQADFTTYVAVGNSLTAGFQSGALRKVRQENSFPAILAAQFAEVGGGAFKQPLLADGPGVGSPPNNGPELKLAYTTDCKGKTSIGPVPSAVAGQADQFSPTTYIGANGPFNNLGVPGAKTFHLVAPGYGNPANLITNPPTANPYYARFANPANYNESVAEAAAKMKPTFFTMWIGANDVLGYGLQGGEEGSDVITATAMFSAKYNETLDSLLKSGAKGVLANIPNITSVPYFNVISRNGLELDANQAAQLNAAYVNYNAGIDAAIAGSVITAEQGRQRKISFVAGANRWVINDPIAGLQLRRHIRYNEHVIMVTPQDSLKCAGWGSSKGIPTNYILTGDEVAKINTAIQEFNNVIKTAAANHNLALLDANKIMSEMESGLTYNGVTYSADFVTGGAFSLDGFHPSTRGYAIIANEFIDVINDKYGAKIRKVDPNSYEGIMFPN